LASSVVNRVEIEALGVVPSNTFVKSLPSPLKVVATTLPNEPVPVNDPLISP
jgi:hypothetical protein